MKAAVVAEIVISKGCEVRNSGSLCKKFRIAQKELAILVGVTVGAAHQWEAGKFKPKDDKMAVLVRLRKLGRAGMQKLLQEKRPS